MDSLIQTLDVSSIGRRRSSWSSSVTTLAPPTPPLSSMPTYLPCLTADTPPHELLLYHPELCLTFPIRDVIHVLHESPVRNSSAGVFSEMRVRIADSGRDSYIRAAEMTTSMQDTLKARNVEDIMSEYQVGRSDEVGSRGLYTLVKNVKDRPHSLIIPPGLLSFASGPKSPKSPKSGLTPKSIFAMLTPRSSFSLPASKIAALDDGYFENAAQAAVAAAE